MSAAIEHYEMLLEQHVMNTMTGHCQMNLKQYVQYLIEQDAAQYMAINYAYLNIKKQLVG